MKHLINHSVYSPAESLVLPDGDGVELLTGYAPVDTSFFDRTVSVHLPYSTDWYSVWSDRIDVPDDLSDDDARFIFYGRNGDDIVRNLTDAVKIASPLNPEYGVMHAGSANINELLAHDYSCSDSEILCAFAEMMNRVASGFPNGEMPFRIVFENQWWPGVKFLDDSGFRILEKKIEFENWGLCLDTGHLLVTTKRSYDEDAAIEILEEIIDSYPSDMMDAIDVMHLHVNTSAEFINGHDDDPGFKDKTVSDRLSIAYPFVCKMDEHRPFSDARAVDIVDRVSPCFVTHEMGASDPADKMRDYIGQRTMFQR